MTLEELLKSQEFTPEQIAAVVAGMKDNNISLLSPEQQEQLKKYEELLPEHTKLKEDYDASVAAGELLKKAAEKSKGELDKLHIDVQVRDALRSAKVKDMDYALYKLALSGELALDKDGKVTDLDSRVKALVETIPDNFSKEPDKTVVVKKPEPFNMNESVTEPQNLKEAVQAAYTEQE